MVFPSLPHIPCPILAERKVSSYVSGPEPPSHTSLGMNVDLTAPALAFPMALFPQQLER